MKLCIDCIHNDDCVNVDCQEDKVDGFEPTRDALLSENIELKNKLSAVVTALKMYSPLTLNGEDFGYVARLYLEMVGE